MKRNLLTGVLALAAQAAFAGSPMPPLTRIVHRYIWPGGSAEAFAAKPKTLYIGGDKYARVEEEPDPEVKIRKLPEKKDIYFIQKQTQK